MTVASRSLATALWRARLRAACSVRPTPPVGTRPGVALFSSGVRSTGDGRTLMDRAKPYDIPKREVWEAYKTVRANHGAAGVDGQTISDFEADLENNLYKLWNRLSSGSCFPPPVRRVDIPKSDGKMRPLGIPTVADRIAQTVVKRHLEPLVEPKFHRIPMDTGPANRRSMRLARRGSDAGVMTGFLISISRPSLTASRRNC